jgi:hypothetical protein
VNHSITWTSSLLAVVTGHCIYPLVNWLPAWNGFAVNRRCLGPINISCHASVDDLRDSSTAYTEAIILLVYTADCRLSRPAVMLLLSNRISILPANASAAIPPIMFTAPMRFHCHMLTTPATVFYENIASISHAGFTFCHEYSPLSLSLSLSGALMCYPFLSNAP